MEYINFYTVSFGLLVILISLFIWMWRKHKYNSREIAGQIVKAEVAAYNPYDPKFNKIAHKNAILGLILGGAFLFIDLLAGFPEIDNSSYITGRIFYIVVIFWSLYVLVRDRAKQK
jgi:hypothetical protein